MKNQDSPLSRRSIEVLAFFTRPPEQNSLSYFTYTASPAHSFSSAATLYPPALSMNPADAVMVGCAPLLCLSNLNDSGGFSPKLAHLLFTDEKLQESLINELCLKLDAGDYYGLLLSFNYLFPFDRENFSPFVHKLSELLHEKGCALFLELAPPERVNSAQDYAALGEAADRISLMFCRWAHSASPPQALAPMDRLLPALEHAVGNIPASKLLLGISGLGYDWRLPWHQGDEARALSNLRAVELAASQAAQIKRDASGLNPWFLYRDADARRHAVFFEDEKSIEQKLSLVDEFSLAGISLYPGDRLQQSVLHLLEKLHSAEKLL